MMLRDGVRRSTGMTERRRANGGTVLQGEGVTTVPGVSRRFNDFLKLLTDLKRAFPRKRFPSAFPPKGLLRMKAELVLEARRCFLEEWITILLSDIELASVQLQSFRLQPENLSTDGNGSFVEESTTVWDALRLLSISDDQIEDELLHCFISI